MGAQGAVACAPMNVLSVEDHTTFAATSRSIQYRFAPDCHHSDIGKVYVQSGVPAAFVEGIRVGHLHISRAADALHIPSKIEKPLFPVLARHQV